MYIHQKLEFLGFFEQKQLCNFKINTHSTGIWNENNFIAIVWQERKLVNISVLPQD